MKISQRLTRTLLITGLLLGALWAASPPTGEAATNPPSDGTTWERTIAAVRRTFAGDCPDPALSVCREECDYGEPTGNFRCFAQ